MMQITNTSRAFVVKDSLATQSYFTKELQKHKHSLLTEAVEAAPEESVDLYPDELRLVAEFISGSAFYIEKLEELLGEPMEDFWISREEAYRIITRILYETALIMASHAGDSLLAEDFECHERIQ